MMAPSFGSRRSASAANSSIAAPIAWRLATGVATIARGHCLGQPCLHDAQRPSPGIPEHDFQLGEAVNQLLECNGYRPVGVRWPCTTGYRTE